MALFDYILIIILIFYFIVSYFNGFIKEIVSVFKWFLGFYISKSFYKNISELFSNNIKDSLTSDIISFIVIFLIIFILANIISALLTRIFKFVGLGGINSLFGGILGVSKMLIIILFIIILLSLTSLINQRFITNSLSYPYFKSMIKLIMPYMPSFIQERSKIFSNK